MMLIAVVGYEYESQAMHSPWPYHWIPRAFSWLDRLPATVWLIVFFEDITPARYSARSRRRESTRSGARPRADRELLIIPSSDVSALRPTDCEASTADGPESGVRPEPMTTANAPAMRRRPSRAGRGRCITST